MRIDRVRLGEHGERSVFDCPGRWGKRREKELALADPKKEYSPFDVNENDSLA